MSLLCVIISCFRFITECHQSVLWRHRSASCWWVIIVLQMGCFTFVWKLMQKLRVFILVSEIWVLPLSRRRQLLPVGPRPWFQASKGRRHRSRRHSSPATPRSCASGNSFACLRSQHRLRLNKRNDRAYHRLDGWTVGLGVWMSEWSSGLLVEWMDEKMNGEVWVMNV